MRRSGFLKIGQRTAPVVLSVDGNAPGAEVREREKYPEEKISGTRAAHVALLLSETARG